MSLSSHLTESLYRRLLLRVACVYVALSSLYRVAGEGTKGGLKKEDVGCGHNGLPVEEFSVFAEQDERVQRAEGKLRREEEENAKGISGRLKLLPLSGNIEKDHA